MSEHPAPSELALRSKVAPEHAGLTLLEFLCQRFPYHDRDAWRSEIEARRLHVGGRLATAKQLLARGAQVTYYKVHHEPRVATDVQILHRDEDFVIASKPAHLPMHADGPFVRNTFVHLLAEQIGCAVHPVHRLDRETSGVLCVALTADARRTIGQQFAAGEVRKHYLAVVTGAPQAEFIVNSPIGRAADSTISLRRSAAANAIAPQPATTRFTTLARGAGTALLRCQPRTGRTHQIRVHLEHAGSPLLGDKLYGRPDADYLAFVHRVKAGADAREVPNGEPDRQLLHAHTLQFCHPRSAALLRFVAPLPADFAAWLQRLGLPAVHADAD